MFEKSTLAYRPDQLPGHVLVDVDGKEIGTIMGVSADSVDVGTGPLHLGTHLYVPFDAIAYCTDTRCYLLITRDQVQQQPWHRLPAELPSVVCAQDPDRPTGVRIPYRPDEPKQRQAGQ